MGFKRFKKNYSLRYWQGRILKARPCIELRLDVSRVANLRRSVERHGLTIGMVALWVLGETPYLRLSRQEAQESFSWQPQGPTASQVASPSLISLNKFYYLRGRVA